MSFFYFYAYMDYVVGFELLEHKMNQLFVALG